MVDCFYPWRYFVGECLQQGKLPLWNPYQYLGYPIHADPSSGAWYPIAWVIGYLNGYSIYSIGVELVLHILLAGIGFYKLSKTLRLSDNTAFIAGVCYMLSGIFIGNAQHLFDIVSACWLPFVLNYYFKMIEDSGYINSVKAAFFVFLSITGGYPAFSFILFYLLVLIFVWQSVQYIKNKQTKTLLLFIKRNILFFIASVLLSSVTLTAIYEVIPYITRTSTDFSVTNSLIAPFSPQSCISFLLPFATIKNPEFFNTDISMSNAYFGILLFIFFVYGLFMKKSVYLNILFGFSIFSLLASFGGYLPVRAFLFDYVPLMNLFRFPSVFRLFVILGFLLVAAYSFDKFISEGFEKQKKRMIRLATVFIVLFVMVIAVSRIHDYLNVWNIIKYELLIFSRTTTLVQHIAFQSILQIGVLLLFIIILLKVSDKQKPIKLLSLLIVIDMIICAQLNAPYTVYYKEFSAKESQHHINKSPKGFPMPSNIPIATVKPDSLYFGPFWKNLNIFQKEISPDGYNSFRLTSYERLRDSLTMLHQKTCENPIVFLSDKIYPNNQLNTFKKDSTFTNKTLFFNLENFSQLNKLELKQQIGDTAYLTHFAPDNLVVESKTKHPQILVLLQNYYPGWEVYINSQKSNLFVTNTTVMSVLVPEGNNTIEFTYTNKRVQFAFYVSVVSIVLCLIFIGVFEFTSFKKKR